MKDHRSRSWLILLAVFLLLAVSIGCSCGQVFQEWLTQFVQDLKDAIESWIREQVALLIANLQRQITDWWNGLLQDIKQGMEDAWRNISQGWRDFWSNVRPPAPVIAEPADGMTAAGANITVRGTALPDSTVALSRNGTYVRETKANPAGQWVMAGIMLSKGENSFTAIARKWLSPSPSSSPVRVAFAGADLGSVPVMTPAISDDLDPVAWMLELALERLKDDGLTFYEEERLAYKDALHKGLQASAGDDIGHHFINPENPLSFGKYAVALLVPKDTPDAEIVQTLAESVESVVLDEGVRTEIVHQISDSMTRLDAAWTLSDGGVTTEWQYIRVDFEGTYLETHFDPSSMAKFKTSLVSGFIKSVGGELTGAAAESIVKLAFAVWGLADADQQAQHFFDLAVRAWNQRGLDGQALRWDDATANGFDGATGYSFATNQEWAMFYLGRAAFYVQSVADPYYTIPFYTPDSQLWADYTHRLVAEVAEARLEKAAAAKFGTVIGGGGPVTALFAGWKIIEWMLPYVRYTDALEGRDEHRPNFAEFVAGSTFEAPIRPDLKGPGASTDQVGYPYRGPADLVLHRYLGATNESVEQRTIAPTLEFDAETILDPVDEVMSLGSSSDPASLVREVALHSATYVHKGNFMQADRRVPEGDMIYPNAFFVREAFASQRLDGTTGPWWETPEGTRLRLTLLDGSVIEGVVAYQPGEPITTRYMDGQHYLAYAPTRVVGLEETSYLAGSMTGFPFTSTTLMTVVGDEEHLYVVFDAARATNQEGSIADVPSMATVVIGIAGNRSQAGLFEQDGVAAIGVDRLAVGVLGTQRLLEQFAEEAPVFLPPDPIVCPSNAVCAALASPATLHVRDRSGRHVGPNAAGGVDLEISGSRYFTDTATGHQFIIVPEANLREEYEVRVEGTGSGSFDLDVFYSDGRHDRAYRQAYTDVPLVPGTVAEVAVQVADSLPLRLDETGDGVFERDVTPARTYEVAVFEPGVRGTPWEILIAGVALILLGIVLLIVVVRLWRRRRRSSAPPPPPVPPQIPANPPVGGAAQACARCGQIARPGARFCLNCGAPLAAAPPPAPAVCPRCGTVAQRSGARFCPKCGGQLF